MTQKTTVVGALLIFVIGALSIASTAQSSAIDIKPLVLTGQAVPGGNGALFTGLGRPSINRFGVVAFRGELTGSEASYDSFKGNLIPDGIFVATNNSLSRIVGFGDLVPGTSTSFTSFGDPIIDDQGNVAFVARVGAGFENQRIFLHMAKSMLTIAQTGVTAPGTGGNFKALGQHGLALNKAETIAFVATFDGPSAGEGIFAYSNGMLTPVVLHGQPAPNGQGQVFDQILGLAMNDAGQIAFAASLASKPGAQGSGVFIASGGQIKVGHLADPVPAGGGSTFLNLGEPSINEVGDVAFVESSESHTRGTLSVPRGVAITASGATSIVSASRQPTHPSDPVISGNFKRPIIVRGSDGTNTALFLASAQTVNRNALWLYQHNVLSPILQEGDPSVVGGIHSLIGQATLSPSGYLVFVSNLKGTTARAGIFITKIKL